MKAGSEHSYVAVSPETLPLLVESWRRAGFQPQVIDRCVQQQPVMCAGCHALGRSNAMRYDTINHCFVCSMAKEQQGHPHIYGDREGDTGRHRLY